MGRYSPKPAGHSGGKKLRSPTGGSKNGAKKLSRSKAVPGSPKQKGPAGNIAALQNAGSAARAPKKGSARTQTIAVIQDSNRTIRGKAGSVTPKQKGGPAIRAIRGPRRVKGGSASGVQGAK